MNMDRLACVEKDRLVCVEMVDRTLAEVEKHRELIDLRKANIKDLEDKLEAAKLELDNLYDVSRELDFKYNSADFKLKTFDKVRKFAEKVQAKSPRSGEIVKIISSTSCSRGGGEYFHVVDLLKEELRKRGIRVKVYQEVDTEVTKHSQYYSTNSFRSTLFVKGK